jgi:hypothetical protein
MLKNEYTSGLSSPNIMIKYIKGKKQKDVKKSKGE